MRKLQINTTKKYNMLKIKCEASDRYDPNGRARRYVLCECDCGNIKEIALQSILHNRSKSCGCIQKNYMKSIKTKHGMAFKTPTYSTWLSIKRRCYNPKDPRYEAYGGRGIVMFDLWKEDFKAFYEYIGIKPSRSYSIDRINNDKGYIPGNIRWATPIEQANNRRKRRWKVKPQQFPV